MRNDVLVVEISGKRPGSSKERPTEKFEIDYDKLIISNNSNGYKTEWNIVNVPKDYEEWYKAHIKNSDNAWYAPMNRSYAIKYAREKGYKYLIQLDDNIVNLQIAYIIREEYSNYIFKKQYRESSKDMMNDFIDMIVCVLENTNAGMVGCNMSGAAMPSDVYLSERYCYSLFGLNLNVIPDHFQGDFEDDIEFRLKLNQMNIPSLQIATLMYGKTSQQINKDLSGCRAEYLKAGVKRGEHMRVLYGDIYSAGLSYHSNKAGHQEDNNVEYFRHRLKPIKIGVKLFNKNAIDNKMKELLYKYSHSKNNSFIVKEKKIKST